MIVLPPVIDGAVQEQPSWLLPGVQVTLVGASAVVVGVALADDDEYAESPAAFVANT